MLGIEKIKEIILAEDDPKIKWAREMNNKLMLHVEGVGLQDFLARINNYENERQFEARQKHAISNKFITEELLRPTDNAFNARGGSQNYKFDSDSEEKEKEFASKLANIKNSHPLSWYIENEWFNKFITDPNGLIVIETDAEEIEKTKREAYPTYKSIHSIKNYQQNGIYVDWVVFEKHKSDISINKKLFGKNTEENTDYHWAVDEKNWYLVKRYDKEISIENTLPHIFGKVPAILCSGIVDNVTGWKKSPIDAQVELLDKFVTSHSVLTIAEFFHNYLQQYIYVDDCKVCNGEGVLNNVKCPHCENGMADRKDVTDIIKLRIPEEGQQKIDPPSGFIYAPTEPWELMNKSVDRCWDKIFFSHWGTELAKIKTDNNDYATATGRFIDAQPINNRLNKYSKSIEQAHTAIAKFIGKYYYQYTFIDVFIQYGRRYLIETPDQIWEKYLDAKSQKAPVTTLDILLNQYLESEFRENETMLAVEIKKMKLEPFVHWDIETVRGSQTIGNKEKNRKEFFSEWVQTKSTEELYSTKIEDLRVGFEKFADSKLSPVT